MLTMNKIKSILRQANRQTDRRFNCANFLSNKKFVLGSIALIGLLIIVISYSFAALTPTPSIIVSSSDDKDNGGVIWKFEKNAEWISKSKARINIELYTEPEGDIRDLIQFPDTILVLDTSGSMAGEKLESLQNSVGDFIHALIEMDSKVSLVTFNDTATMISEFTDDADLLYESLDNLTAAGETNYYQALFKIDEILSTYNKGDKERCKVLFLTDGLPTIDTPNEIAEYNYLKNKYDYLDIVGIQYELGDEILQGLKNVTDVQYLAAMDNLIEVLALLYYPTYDNFTLTDYVDTNYFNLDNVYKITTTYGNATIDKNKVVWDLSNLPIFLNASLTIDIDLNNDLVGVGGIYPTHTKTDLSYKIGSASMTESTTETTVLKDKNSVIYEANAPSGCLMPNVPSPKNYFVFDTVQIEKTIPVCVGYQFDGWEIVNTNVEKVGNDKFIMPAENVTLRAVWKKLNIKKSMRGRMADAQTLYKIVANGSKGLDTNVNFNSTPTDADSGVYTIASTKNDEYPVHYYRGNIGNNNVLFAGFCWKIVRTTSTGGVKLIYNGTYDENNKCNNTGEDSQIGTSAFNSSSNSPADVGYMYGTRYTYSNYGPGTINVLNRYLTSSTSNYYYGNSVTYSNGTYTLNNSLQKTWSDNYSNLVGYYTCRSTSTTCSTVYYIAGSTSSAQHVILLSGGITDPTTQTITLGKGATDNGNGTYSLTDTVTIAKKDWFTDCSKYKGYYVCTDSKSTTCDNKYLITSTGYDQLSYDRTFNYIYGNDVSWDGSKYTLTDTFTSTNSWSIDRTTLAKKYHYTCLNTTGECDKVHYIHYFGVSTDIYYSTLSSGKDIETAKDEMFTNTNSSEVKQTIDTWYATNMTSYTEKLEDTIWCNDRTLYSGSLVGKNKDAGTGYSLFSANNRAFTSYNLSIDCPNEERDGFTVSTISGGNGFLTYPVGLLTADEIRLAGGNNKTHYLYTGQWYWTLSPSSFNVQYYAYIIHVYSSGYLFTNGAKFSGGVRPSVSLAPGIRSVGGDGTVTNPYVIGDE